MLERSESAKFLLGWVVRGNQTASLLEEGAKRVGLIWKILSIKAYLDAVYGKETAFTLYSPHAHERGSLKVWEFKWAEDKLNC